MDLLPPMTPAKRRMFKKRNEETAPPTPPVVALTLVAASYSEATWVRLTFDRAIDISSIDPSQITVRDGQMAGKILTGVEEAVLISPVMVEIPVVEGEPFSDDYIALYATALSGIVAVDDGGTWAGVHEVVLPFS